MSDKEEKAPVGYTYFEQRIVHKVHHYYLISDITEQTNYVEMIHHILTAPPDEEIHIHINTVGGDLSTATHIVNAMLASQAYIVCHLEANAFSAGAMIFLAGREWVVHEHVMMMLHNYTGQTFGKENEILAHMDGQQKWNKAFTKALYIPFLSEEEYNDVIDGKDLWLQSSDIRKRLNKVVREHKKALKKSEKE